MVLIDIMHQVKHLASAASLVMNNELAFATRAAETIHCLKRPAKCESGNQCTACRVLVDFAPFEQQAHATAPGL